MEGLSACVTLQPSLPFIALEEEEVTQLVSWEKKLNQPQLSPYDQPAYRKSAIWLAANCLESKFGSAPFGDLKNC